MLGTVILICLLLVSGLILFLLMRFEGLLHEESRGSREELSGLLKENRQELNTSLEGRITGLNEFQQKRFEELFGRFDRIQQSVEKRLDEMKGIVDEKLQTVLEKRLSESFKLVSERLEQVHKGLGEMQGLAAGVGDLKKVLSNVKTQGILGEYQLERLLESLLTPEQYETNVHVKRASGEAVEYAIKLPGRNGDGPVYLPVDSKFPLAPYQNMTAAYESGDVERIKAANKVLENAVLNCAQTINKKYLNPPKTTDFGVLFLPFEGLFAEVVRKTELMETLHRDLHIVVMGPTNFAVFLNSLQMGFHTLAIQKRSGEVWKVLSAVKTEFASFEKVLKLTQDRLNQAATQLDALVGARTRKIVSKLKEVQELPVEEASAMIEEASPEEEELTGGVDATEQSNVD